MISIQENFLHPDFLVPVAQEGYEIFHNLKGPYVCWEGITRNDERSFFSLSWLTNQVGSGARRCGLASDKACVSLALGSPSPATPELVQSKRECTALGQRRVTASAGSAIGPEWVSGLTSHPWTSSQRTDLENSVAPSRGLIFLEV